MIDASHASGAAKSAARIALLSLLVLFVSAPAGAQPLPSVIRILVPFSAGGPVDFSARVMADRLKEISNVSFVVENRPGANGAIAALAVKSAPADGSVLLYTSNGMLTITPNLEKNPAYDVLKDFAPISTTSYAECSFVVNPGVKANDLKAFIALARSQSAPFTIGSAGIGNILHGYLEIFKDSTKLDLTHVPYKGASVALTDVLGGQITGMFVGLSLAAPHVNAGKLKIFGVTGTERSKLLPQVPTFAEQGFSGLEIQSWSGVMAPKDTPQAVIDELAKLISAAMNDEGVKAKLQPAGIASWVVPAAEYKKQVETETRHWSRVLTMSAVKPK